MTRVQGRLTRLTLGEWPITSLADAHEEARKAKQLAKGGCDPREARHQLALKAQEARKLTFGGMAEEFLTRYAKPKLRARTVEEYTRTLIGQRTEPWHHLPVASINRHHVITLLDGLEAEGKHATAKLTLAYLRKFFGWCAERDVIAEIPTHRIRLNGIVKPRERALTVEELQRVWRAVDKIGSIGGALIKILLLTGQRRFETSTMRWRDLSGLESNNPLWSIPGEATKNGRPHQVPLSPEAVAIIRSLPVVQVGPDDSPLTDFVFTSTGRSPWSGFSKLKTQIDRALAEDGTQPMKSWRLHDLRRSFVTGLHEYGLAQPHVIEAAVNHISGLRGGIAGVYNRAVYLEERRRAIEAWANLVIGPMVENNVVPLRAGG